MWKKGIALFLALCMIWCAFGHYIPSGVTKAAEPKKYTVTLTDAENVFLCNETPSDGPVTITYTVETVTKGGTRCGAIATTVPDSVYPYNGDGVGSLHFDNANFLLNGGYKHTITISKDSAGKTEGTYKVTGLWNDQTYSFTHKTGDGNTQAKYFGIWLASATGDASDTITAKLTDVTCVDASGKDLGLKTNSDKCVIADGESETEEPEKYTVDMVEAENVFLCNETSTDGPVTITYTVETASKVGTRCGAIVTTKPEEKYPYDGAGVGSLHFDNASYLLNSGKTHTITITKDSNGQANGTYKVDGLWNNQTYPFSNKVGDGNTEAKYFGIWLASAAGDASDTITAKLTNVTCVDADGKDLGLKTNSDKCMITKESGEDEMTPGDDNNAKKYTLNTNGKADYFFGNKTAASGAVTLRYTVESAAADAAGNNGVVATTDPTLQFPYVSGSMQFHNAENVLMVAGRTYEIVMKLDGNGKVIYAGSYTDAEHTTPVSLEGALPHPTGVGSAASKYFGIYIAPATAAKLVNVTCVDKNGKDLGVLTNQKEEVQPGDDTNAEKHTLEINGKSNYFFSNETAAEGPVTLRYTVESAEAASVGNNGVVATTDPAAEYPYVSGSMQFHHAENILMAAGRTYTIIMDLDANNKVIYSGNYVEGENGVPVSLEGSLPNPAGDGAAASPYFGVYVAPTTNAKLVNVTCVDAEGHDLGIRTNQKRELPAADDGNAVKHSIKTGEEGNFFFSNKKAASGTITLRYTVESAKAEDVGNNGVVATTDPTVPYPYGQDPGRPEVFGSMQFWHADNILMVEGRSYTIVMEMDESGKIIYGGYYTDKNGQNKVSLDGYLPNPAGLGSADSKYFGVFISPVTEVKLSNVTCVDKNGKDLGIQTNLENSLVTSGKDNDTGKTETLDPSYKMITLGNFGIQDGIYRSEIVKGAYALSMHKTVFTVDIEFSSDLGEDFRYGSQTDGWHGLRFWSDGSVLRMEDVDGYTSTYTFIPLIAGTKLVDKEFNLKLSTEYVDSDNDGKKDDVKLGVWFNDKLYNNKYIYLKDYKEILGKYIGVYCSNDIAFIKVKSVAGIPTGVDYTIFGFTREWKKELGIY